MTAAIGLFSRLQLPDPWTAARSPIPLIIYGGSTSVGSFALELATKANIHPLIVVAGAGAPYVESLIDRSKGDTIIDYRKGADAVVEGIKNALRANNQESVKFAFDTVAEKGSQEILSKVIDPHGKVTFVLPYKDAEKYFPETVNLAFTSVGSVHGQETGDRDLGFVYFRYFGKGLEDGWFKGHPYEVRKGGLQGIEAALQDLKAGKASAIKYVFRIRDTPGLESSI